jgi:hypothetical protein
MTPDEVISLGLKLTRLTTNYEMAQCDAQNTSKTGIQLNVV